MQNGSTTDELAANFVFRFILTSPAT